jgi:hypothetical protein
VTATRLAHNQVNARRARRVAIDDGGLPGSTHRQYPPLPRLKNFYASCKPPQGRGRLEAIGPGHHQVAGAEPMRAANGSGMPRGSTNRLGGAVPAGLR